MLNKLFFISFMFSISIYTFAQTGSSVGLTDPRSTAMGGSAVVYSRGVYSIGKNPANLTLMKNHNFEISTLFPIPNVGMKSSNDFFTIDDLNYYFGGVDGGLGQKIPRNLNVKDKNKLRSLFDKGTSLRSLTSINILSLAYNAG